MLISLSAAALAVAWWESLGGFPLDDAYITLHNARVLLEGADPNYGVPATVGATSTVHLVLVAAVGIISPLDLALILVGVTSGVAYIFGVHKIASALDLDRFGTIALTVGSMAGFAGFQILNGVETGLAMAIGVWTLALGLRCPSYPLAVLIGVAPFVRPELAILSLAVGLYHIRRWTFGQWLTCAVVATPFALWVVGTTGAVVPGTAGAKEAFFADVGFPLTVKIIEAGRRLAFSAVGLVLLAGVFGKGKASWVVRGFIGVVLALYVLRLPAGLSHNQGRYLYVLLPAALLGVGYLMRGRHGRLVAVGLLTWTLVTAPLGLSVHFAQTREVTSEASAAINWITTQLPDDSVLLVHDAGYIAWATDFRLIDVVGLKTPSSVDAHERWTVPTLRVDQDKAISAIASGKATHAVVKDAPTWSAIADNLREAGLLRETLYGHPGGFFVYRLAND